MNCYKCATPLPDNSRFCFTCGTDVSGEGHLHEKTLNVEQDPGLIAKLQADVGTEYVIDRELGRGGMAIVYLGHDASLGRKVAVKLLPPELTFGAGPSVIERFKREARMSATLDHPNIIPVYRVSQGQKLFWYVMKFLEGESLDRIIDREGQLPVEQTVDIIRQAADALDYAHASRVIHRDIKPANLMIDAKGRVTLTDFGIAKALDGNALTATGSMIGTPYFMSSEQCAGKVVGPASDQYSLAVMTYLMLGGHLPFTGESVVDIIRQHVMDPVPPLGVLRPQLPPELIAVVERGLAKSPEERFASCNEFAKALAQASQGLDITAAPPRKPSSDRMSRTALVSPVPGALRTAKSTAKDRKGVVIVAVGAVIAAGIVATAVVISQNSAREEQARRDSIARAQEVARVPLLPPPAPPLETLPRVRQETIPTRTPEPRGSTKRESSGGTTGRAARDQRKQEPVAKQPGADSGTIGSRTATPPVDPQPPAAGPAVLFIGSTPASASMTINGVAAPSNPVTNFQVPAPSTVRIVFTWTDETGIRTRNVSIDVTPGQQVRRRIDLRAAP